jgi:glycolate oxidase FAD binding subunit
MTNFSPKTVDDLSRIIAALDAPCRVHCHDTKSSFGNVVSAPHTLNLQHFKGIEIYEPEELILEAGPATRLSAIEKELEKKNQMLAFEPPDHSVLFGSKHEGSIGGIVASAMSGPRRIKAGAVRDHVLGFSGVTGAGLVFKSGARVVKNVTGYDLPKLLTGSHGTLAALTSVTLKVLPRPETETTVQVPCVNATAACRIMADAMGSTAEISGAAFLPKMGVLRVDGIAPSVKSRVEHLAKMFVKSDILKDAASRKAWSHVRDLQPFHTSPKHTIWRLSVPPMSAPSILEKLSALQATYLLDWAGGLIWLAVPTDAVDQTTIVRNAVTEGHATLYRTSSTFRAQINAFPPQATALAALTARVKHAFDPHGRLNPGKIYPNI